MAVQSDGRNFIGETGKRWMVLTSKYYIWTKKFAFVYCII